MGRTATGNRTSVPNILLVDRIKQAMRMGPLSAKQLAARLGCPIGSVHAVMHRNRDDFEKQGTTTDKGADPIRYSLKKLQ